MSKTAAAVSSTASDEQGAARGALAGLPPQVKKRLDDLQTILEKTLGDDLVGLLVFGSAARGEYQEGRSDIDLVVVLREAPRDRLEAVSNALQLARYAARIEAIVLVASEIPRAADVFPLLYDDIRSCHVLLAGEDPFKDLVIGDAHRRLRVEQELREAQIRLRRAVVDAQGSNDMLAGAVARKVRQIRGPLRALLALHGEAAPTDLAGVIRAAAKRWDAEPAPLLKVHDDPQAAHTALDRLLTAAVDDVDRLDAGRISRGAVSSKEEKEKAG